MKIRYLIAVLIVIVLTILVAKVVSQKDPSTLFCENQGNTVETLEYNGTYIDYCVFPDGQKCNSMEFYQGECKWNPTNQPMLRK